MRYLTLALAFVALFSACGQPKQQVQARQMEIRRLPPTEFAKVVNDTSTLVVNAARAPRGEIPGTDISLSSEGALDTLKALQPDVTKPIALYCSEGGRSDTLAEQLARAGYTNVCILNGGYKAWVEQGLPFRLYNTPQN